MERPRSQAHLNAETIVDLVRGLQVDHEKEIALLTCSHARREKVLMDEVESLKKQLEESKTNGDTPNNVDTTAPILHGDVGGATKQEFITFVLGAVQGTHTPEYKQLYHFLLKCFTDADNNFDGRVGFKEFEMLIESAAFLPRRFGYAPSTHELYATDWDRLKKRMKLFSSLDPRKAAKIDVTSNESEYDYISFSMWLRYAVGHIKEKATLLEGVDPRSKMVRSKEHFQEFIITACTSRTTPEYKELYHFVLRCFTESDTDLDGQIDATSFYDLIDKAASAPRLFGFAPKPSELYTDEVETRRAREEIFKSLDRYNSGYIDFDTWLEYIYNHICEKTKALGSASSGEVPSIPNAGRTALCPFGAT